MNNKKPYKTKIERDIKMSSLQKIGFPLALYKNLFDQSAGSELWRLFLTAAEITGSRNDQSVKIRKLGALTSALYGGAGSIDNLNRAFGLFINTSVISAIDS